MAPLQKSERSSRLDLYLWYMTVFLNTFMHKFFFAYADACWDVVATVRSALKDNTAEQSSFKAFRSLLQQVHTFDDTGFTSTRSSPWMLLVTRSYYFMIAKCMQA
jgi:hypothetical protein